MKTQLSFLRLEKHKNDFRETTLHPIGLRNVARRIKGVWSPSFQSGTINLIHVSIVVSPEQTKKKSPPGVDARFVTWKNPFPNVRTVCEHVVPFFLDFGFGLYLSSVAVCFYHLFVPSWWISGVRGPCASYVL